MKFDKALKLLIKGKKVTRNEDGGFRIAFDYIRIGFPDLVDFNDRYETITRSITFWKDGKEVRTGELWVIDYLADDWEEAK